MADLSPGVSGIDADKAITNMTSDSDPIGTVFSGLRFRSTYQSSNSIRLSWKRLSNAKAYIIYGNKCGGSNKPKRLAQSKKYKVKKHVALRYETTNNNIATVSKSGKITAREKGTCYIYAFAQDGAFKKIKVTLK